MSVEPIDVALVDRAPALAIDVTEAGATANLPVRTAPAAPALPDDIDVVASAVASLGAKMKYAEVIVRSSLVPKALTHTGSGWNATPLPIEQAVANVVVVMEYGQLLNLHPIVAMSEIHVLEGKPGMSGKLMRARLRGAGHKLRIKEHTRHRAEVAIKLADDPDSENITFSYDLDDAVKAQLCEKVDGEAHARSAKGKVKPWEASTETMLYERAMAKAIRALCPEVLMGVNYTIEELESMVLDVEEVAPAKERVWPFDYANDTPLKTSPAAKKTLVDLCEGDQPRAAAVWKEHFDGVPVEQLVLGHLRSALGVDGPAGDESTFKPLSDGHPFDETAARPAPGGDDRPERAPNDASPKDSATTAPRARVDYPAEDPAGRVAKRAASAAKRAADRAMASKEHVDTLLDTLANLDDDAVESVSAWLAKHKIVVQHEKLTAADYERAMAHIDETVGGD